MINIPRGTQDILPNDVYKWQFIEQKLHEIAASYNYLEIRTPIFESTDLFVRSVGNSTDIVNKEMYTFKDKGDRSITLKPEGTAPVVRSYIENKMQNNVNQPVKLYYLQPMFRYERKQKGRYRQFVQFGVEAIGVEDPLIDVEVISMVMNIYHSFGLKNLKLVINSVGDIESRAQYNNVLREHFEPVQDELCADCQSRLSTNPMRILDCKRDRDHSAIQNAPKMYDYLNEKSKHYFETVKKQLNSLNIDYTVDHNLVRGLDYYTHTAFELMSDAEGFGAITTLCGGGRYNGLLETLDGPNKTGIGFGLSIERLILALEAENIEIQNDQGLDLYICTMDEASKKKAVQILHEYRKENIKVDIDYENRKLKGQLKDANRKNAKFTIIIGENELNSNQVELKDMATGDQTLTSMDELLTVLKERI